MADKPPGGEPWHLDRRIPIALILAIIGYALARGVDVHGLLPVDALKGMLA